MAVPGVFQLSFSSHFFSYFQKLIDAGEEQGKITRKDLFSLPGEMQAEVVYKRFLSLHRADRKLLHTLHSLIFWEFWYGGIARFGNDVAVIIGTLLIKRIVYYAGENDIYTTLATACAITLCSVFQALCLQQFVHSAFMCGSTAVSAASSIVFHATMALRLQRMNPPKTIGEINNVQSKDAASLRDFIVFAHNLWACPLMVVACVILLIELLGIAGLVSCILLPLMLPLESFISKKARAARKRAMVKADLRMALLGEVVDGIKTVKLTALAPFIYSKIKLLRASELEVAWEGMMIEVVNTVLARSSTLIITLITFAVYIWLSPDATMPADRAFAALAVINVIGRPIQVLPKCITLLSDVIVSCNRIEAIMAEATKYEPNLFDAARMDKNDSDADSSSDFSLTTANLCATRPPKASLVVSDASLGTISGPGLVVVLGGNGSGKSSFLLAMLNELETTGVLNISPKDASIAYVGHDVWILNASFRDNILIAARKTEEGSYSKPTTSVDEMYWQAVRACALDTDLQDWTDGEDTVIGEKGINISGGQKQRIALARAICSDSNILFLDSVTSGLDPAVAQHVISNAIVATSKSRLVVMATHSQEVANRADKLVYMRDGKIIFSGSREEFDKSGIQDVYALTSTPDASTLNVDSMVQKDSSTSNLALPAKDSKRREPSEDVLATSSSVRSYVNYAEACKFHNLGFALLLSIVAFGAGAFGDFLMADWTDGSYDAQEYIQGYSLVSVSIIAVNAARYMMYSYAGIVASTALHDKLTKSILGATFQFFHGTPSGRITSRFSADMSDVDYSIPSSISSLVDAILGIVTGVGVVCVQAPFYVAIVVPLTLQYLRVQNKYRKVSIELKKLDSGSKSPLFSYFREVLAGLETIRGYRLQRHMVKKHYQLLDMSIQARINWDVANRWLGIRLDLIGSLVVSAAAFSVVTSLWCTGSGSGGRAGLMLSYASRATQSLSFAIRAATSLENLFTSSDRIREYCELEQETGPDEPALHENPVSEKENKEVTATSPLSIIFSSFGALLRILDRHQAPTSYQRLSDDSSHGMEATALELVETGVHKFLEPFPGPILIVNNIVAHYAPHLPPAIKGVSFQVSSGKVVAVCGRTGSGKSTLSLVLARALDLSNGSIYLRGRNIQDIPLREYRSELQIFPQDSFMFSGKLRDYLDPTGIFPDEKLEHILGQLAAVNTSETTSLIADGREQQISLDMELAAGGSNLSAGQKQTVVLARAALTGARVCVLDEITSNMDVAAARRAIDIIRNELGQRGVACLVISHTPEEIEKCDEVLTMAGGLLV